jgi:prepilin signal peptidase PulO-like enzyme (type II secretory pathway)
MRWRRLIFKILYGYAVIVLIAWAIDVSYAWKTRNLAYFLVLAIPVGCVLACHRHERQYQRRQHRIAAGHCLKCGYNLRDISHASVCQSGANRGRSRIGPALRA